MARLVDFALALAATAVLFLVLWSPARALAQAGIPLPPGSDKAFHLLGFLALAAFWHRAWRHLGSPRLRTSLTIALAAAVTELGQLRVPGRSAEALDLLADLAGLAIFLLWLSWSGKRAISSAGTSSTSPAAAPEKPHESQ